MIQHTSTAQPTRSELESVFLGIFGSPVSFPRRYTILLLLGALDLCITTLILHLGGHELNGVANWILREFGLAGITIFKFFLLGITIVICEALARLKPALASDLIDGSAAISLFPVVVGLLWLAEVGIDPEESLRLLAAARAQSNELDAS